MPNSLPEVILITRAAWTGNDGTSYVREDFEVRGGNIAPDWASSLRPPALPWCRVTIWNEDRFVSGYGGEVWPSAWPVLFQTIGPRGRETTQLTDVAAALFATARTRA